MARSKKVIAETPEVYILGKEGQSLAWMNSRRQGEGYQGIIPQSYKYLLVREGKELLEDSLVKVAYPTSILLSWDVMEEFSCFR